MRPTYELVLIILFNGFTAISLAEQRPLWNETWTDKLKRDLLHKYDKFARPAQHFNVTTVTFDILFQHLSLDEFKSTMNVNGLISHSWTDEKLKWNTSNYNGLSAVHVGNHEIWQPDIVLYNSATPNSVDHYGDTHCIVYNTGTVLWVPPAQLYALCDINIRFWPFDTQVCTLKIGSWTFHGGQIDLQLKEPASEEKIYIKNAEWSFMNLTRKRTEDFYSCCKEHYVALHFTLTLKRNSALYSNILVIPAVAVVFLTLSTFWLSPQSELKIILSACTSLIICIFLLFFGFKLPLTTKPPLIVYFYSGCLCHVTISLVLSIFVINVSRRPHCKPLPRNIRLLLLSWPGKMLGLSNLITMIESRRPMPAQELRGKVSEDFSTNSNSNIVEDCDRQKIISPSKNMSQLEWIIAGTALDRLAFIILSIVFGTMTVICAS